MVFIFFLSISLYPMSPWNNFGIRITSFACLLASLRHDMRISTGQMQLIGCGRWAHFSTTIFRLSLIKNSFAEVQKVFFSLGMYHLWWSQNHNLRVLCTKDTSRSQGSFRHDIWKILSFRENLVTVFEIKSLEWVMLVVNH